MKILLIIRHAKSDQSFFGNDFERPLNDRGNKDAPAMAQKIAARNIVINALVSSPAKRAKKTAALFCSSFNFKEEEIIFLSALYHAPADVFYEVISNLNDTHNTVAIVAHNPGISYFVNDLVVGVRVDNMPTCAVFAVQANIKQWKDFAKAKKELLFFDYPKNN